MPRTSKKTPASFPNEITEQWGQMTAINGDAMQAFAQACQAYASCIASLNKEFMGFVSTRLDRDVELSQALTQCGNWSDAVDLQQKWARQATEEYMTEAGRITALASNLAKEAWKPVYRATGQAPVGGETPSK